MLFLSREQINTVFLLFSNKTVLETIDLTVQVFSFYENSDSKLLLQLIRVEILGKAYSI